MAASGCKNSSENKNSISPNQFVFSKNPKFSNKYDDIFLGLKNENKYGVDIEISNDPALRWI